MAKIALMNFPPGYESLIAKVVAWFDNQIYPTWATRNRQNTRSAKKALKEKTILPKVKPYWDVLSPTEKLAWKNARYGVYRSSYSVFVSDFGYRAKNGLTLPGTASATHQVYGLQMSNFGGIDYVTLERHDIVCTGLLNVHFSYKKIERYEASLWPFGLSVDAYYFESGENKIDTYDWEAPAGNVDWTEVSFSYGKAGRFYFHVVCTFSLWLYDADILFDNFLVSDALGDVCRDVWKLTSKGEWNYQPKVRKQGWLFDPGYVEPFFKVLYLDQ